LTVAPGVPVGAQNTCGDPNTSCHFRLHNVDGFTMSTPAKERVRVAPSAT
jgi:hypothetical protein